MTQQRLQDTVVGFVRAFGLLRSDRTPCGQPVSVSAAHALMELAAADGLSQNDLAARLRLDKSTVSRLVAELERRGWVRRSRDAADGRVLRLGLTEPGARQAATLDGARTARFARILAAIPPDDREPVLRGLASLLRATLETENGDDETPAELGSGGRVDDSADGGGDGGGQRRQPGTTAG